MSVFGASLDGDSDAWNAHLLQLSGEDLDAELKGLLGERQACFAKWKRHADRWVFGCAVVTTVYLVALIAYGVLVAPASTYITDIFVATGAALIVVLSGAIVVRVGGARLYKSNLQVDLQLLYYYRLLVGRVTQNRIKYMTVLTTMQQQLQGMQHQMNKQNKILGDAQQLLTKQADQLRRAVAVFLAEGDAEAEHIVRETDRLLATGGGLGPVAVVPPSGPGPSAGEHLPPPAEWPPAAAAGGANVHPFTPRRMR